MVQVVLERIELSERARGILSQLAAAPTSPYRPVERSRILLMSAEGLSNRVQGRTLGVDHQRVRRWRRRWPTLAGKLAAMEADGAEPRELRQAVVAALEDAPRSGAPAKFSAEQVARIVALACEKPEKSGVPVTHWTARELARVAVERKIVASISPRQVARFFGGGRVEAAPKSVLAHLAGQTRKPGGIRGKRSSGL